MTKLRLKNTIQRRLQYLTEESHRERMKESLDVKVTEILNQAEREARSGSGKYYITIDKPEMNVIMELEDLGLIYVLNEGNDKCRVSWYKNGVQ